MTGMTLDRSILLAFAPRADRQVRVTSLNFPGTVEFDLDDVPPPVDMVLIFSDDTPIPLLEVLEPDVLVKGGDYTIEEVVGAELVQSYGGQVKLATHVRGHSSTQVISKMSRRPVPKSGPSAGTSR